MRLRLYLLGLILAAWGASIAGPFHFDDYLTLVDPLITAPDGWLTVWQPIQTRPLSQFTFWLSYWTTGPGAPWAFHLWNLVLHAACTWLVYHIAARASTSNEIAVIAASLFAIHPMAAEAVNYVFARSSQLSTLFTLLALDYWLRERRWSSVAWFAAALLAKEECVSFPIFLALLGWRRWRLDWKPLVAMLALSIGLGGRVLLLTKFVTASGGGFASKVSAADYFTAQGYVILRYLRLLVVPWGFTVDTQIDTVLPWLCWAVLAVLVVIAARYGKEAGLWFVGALVLLAPSSSIFPADDLAADRRMYLPLASLAIAAAFVARRANANGKVLAAIGLVLLGLSIGRTLVWNSERALWQEAVERSPGKARPRIQLARSLPPSEAVRELEDASRLFPSNADIPTEEGRILITAGQPAEALAAFGRALAIEPSGALYRNNRGVALAALGQREAARRDFEAALQSDPCFEDARRNLTKLGLEPVAKPCPVPQQR